MKNLHNKFKEGVKKVWNKAKPIVLPVAAGTILYFATAQDVDAQKRPRYPKDHLWGDYFTIDKSGKQWNLEEKVFHPGERILLQETEITEENELGMIGYDAHTVKLVLDGETKEPKALKSDEQIIYKQVGTSLKLATKGKYGLRAGGLCDDQIAEKVGVCENQAGYIAPVNIKDFLPDIKTVVINDIEYFWPIVAEDKLNEEGKTKHYLIRKDSSDIIVDYADKSITFEGKIYRGIEQKLEEEKRMELIPGQGTKLSTDTLSKKRNFHLIVGANGNDKFLEGQFGVQYGPFALGANIGKRFNEKIDETETEPSLLTGNHGYGKITEENKLTIGPFAELHFRPNKAVDPFVGAGMSFWFNNLEIVDGIKDSNGSWKPGSPQINSKTETEKSYKGYGGVNFKVGKNSKLGLQAGFDSRAKFNAGVRYSIRLGK